ncbi:hypothetical protein L0337_45260 [candidate division KSB1 bacterium]|nr:hypothetical protein [candidate division KSB1 bacterium]
MLDEREWQTRKQRIDTKLRALNPAWKIVRFQDSLDTSQLDRHAVEEYPTANGPADYELFVNGQLLGIIEAKKVTVKMLPRHGQGDRFVESLFDAGFSKTKISNSIFPRLRRTVRVIP